jgi:hypothetical protein
MNSLRSLGSIFGLVVLLVSLAAPAIGCPILQIYVEGASYDTTTESWHLVIPPGTTGQASFRLWVIGNPNPKGPIYNVRLAIAYDEALRDLSGDLGFSLVPSTTGGLGGFTDPSVPSSVSWVQNGGPGTVPTIVGSSRLPPHGVYGPSTVWQEFSLGNFSLKDSPIGDFYQTFPSPTCTMGQINVYDVSVFHTGRISVEGTTLHLDVYGYVKKGGKKLPVFAPFSHDGQVNVVPVPGAIALSLSMLVSGAGWAWLRRRWMARNAS